MADSRELRERRGHLVHEMAKVREEANTGDGGWTEELRTKFDRMEADERQLKIDIDDMERVERSVALDESLTEIQNRGSHAARRAANAGQDAYTYAEQNEAFKRYVQGDVDAEVREKLSYAGFSKGKQGGLAFDCFHDGPTIRSAADARDLAYQVHTRATTPQATTTGSKGGHLVATITSNRVRERLVAIGQLRANATVLRTENGQTIQMPCVDDTGNIALLVAEGSTYTVDSISLSQKALEAYNYRTGVVTSNELITDAVIDLPAFIGEQFGIRLARGLNKAFTTGNGTAKPHGIRVEAGTGVSTSSNTITYANVMDLVNSVDPAYHDNSKFSSHYGIINILKKLQDGNSRPLWVPHFAEGEPDRLAGFPWFFNQAMPSSATSNTALLLFGDHSAYTIRDVARTEIMVNRERLSPKYQTEFLLFSRHDGRTLYGATANDVIKGVVGTT